MHTAVSEGSTRDVASILRDIMDSLSALRRATGREIELEVLTPAATSAFASDLRAAMRSLLECSLGMGTGPVRLVSRLEQDARRQRFMVTEVINDGLDVPDQVRRKLSKAVGAQAGQTSFVSARTGSCVKISIPIAPLSTGELLAAA